MHFTTTGLKNFVRYRSFEQVEKSILAKKNIVLGAL